MTVAFDKFDSVLVANRGEIALRVMRTAREMGYRTIAVYSEADAGAPHVQFADEAILIGLGPVGESYLDPQKILDAAKTSGAGAIHPGYGFLSENSAFAKACEDAGIVFIGPPTGAVDLMGDKAKAKRHMIDASVPCVPGYEGEAQDQAVFLNAADEIGFPVMVKAAAGGGGRGMRLVHDMADLPDALKLARSEAENAFGSGDLILEKAIIRPRHVEIQVFGDSHGNYLYFGERDCSVQRRHQKVIEEAPCPVMTPQLRQRMGEAAVAAAKSVDYVGAGTVEFLLDSSGEFYFLEMNTRLQVEHPVTELITDIDLVALQLDVAQGAALPLAQDEVTLDGHAIEVRIYAEDPSQDFLPATGHIDLWLEPSGEGVRVDAGVQTGQDVSPFYDPMVAKIMAWGPNREMARRRLISALGETALFGVPNNRDFLIDALARDDFATGSATTAFIAETYGEGAIDLGQASTADLAVAAVLQYDDARENALAHALPLAAPLVNFASAGALSSPYQYELAGEVVELIVQPLGPDSYCVTSGDEATEIALLGREGNGALVEIAGKKSDVLVQNVDEASIHICINGRTLSLRDMTVLTASAADEAGGGTVIAPMHGLLLELFVSAGDSVKKGDRLAILEAMKMQHEIEAEVDGVVKEIAGVPGEQIAADDLILEIEETK